MDAGFTLSSIFQERREGDLKLISGLII